jgi:aryl sulfotransferase
MKSTNVVWPKKQREYGDAILDSTRWNSFEFRDDDIVIGTWPKSGTTLTQQIVCQLVFKGAEDAFGQELSPWIDFRITPADEVLGMAAAQHHRRFLKTHLPLDALVFSPKAKYIYIGRDARDVVWSWHHHHAITSDAAYRMLNPPDRTWPEFPRPDSDVRRVYHRWLDMDGYPLFPYWSHVQGWWNIRALPNVLLMHFNQLLWDLPGSVRAIAAFLGIAIDEAKFPLILEHCSIEHMRRAAAEVDFLDVIFDGGGGSFIYKGTNGRWKDVLSADEIAKADLVASQNLTPDCANWLRTGGLPAASPGS